MLKFFLRQDSTVIRAGLFNEKVGIMENPFVVTPRLPENLVVVIEESVCEKSDMEQCILVHKNKKRHAWFIGAVYWVLQS